MGCGIWGAQVQISASPLLNCVDRRKIAYPFQPPCAKIMTIIPSQLFWGLNEITLSEHRELPVNISYDHIIAISVYSISSQPPSVGIVCPLTQILIPTVQLSFYTGDSQVPVSRPEGSSPSSV